MLSTPLKDQRKKLGLTLDAVAEIVGVSKSTVRKWELGMIANMKRDKIVLLAEALQVTPFFILGLYEENKPLKKILRIPFFKQSALASSDFDFDFVFDYEEIISDITLTDPLYALKIEGMSMAPRFLPDDIVIVKRVGCADNGNVVVVIINGKEAVIRTYKKEPGGIALVPLNPSFETSRFSTDEISSLPVVIIGVVIELRAKLCI